MLVCHCKCVSDRAIRAAIGSGACSRGSLARACGAGTGCGGCLPVVDAILRSERETRGSVPVLAAEDLTAAG